MRAAHLVYLTQEVLELAQVLAHDDVKHLLQDTFRIEICVLHPNMKILKVQKPRRIDQLHMRWHTYLLVCRQCLNFGFVSFQGLFKLSEGEEEHTYMCEPQDSCLERHPTTTKLLVPSFTWDLGHSRPLSVGMGLRLPRSRSVRSQTSLFWL